MTNEARDQKSETRLREVRSGFVIRISFGFRDSSFGFVNGRGFVFESSINVRCYVPFARGGAQANASGRGFRGKTGRQRTGDPAAPFDHLRRARPDVDHSIFAISDAGRLVAGERR